MNDLGVTDHENRGLDGKRGNPQGKDTIRAHIDKFPRIESHYARKDSKREYLESSLSLGKMFDLYVE